MDDLESLVYSIAFIAGVPMDPSKNREKFPEVMPEGYVLFENLKKGKKFARTKILVRIYLKLVSINSNKSEIFLTFRIKSTNI